MFVGYNLCAVLLYIDVWVDMPHASKLQKHLAYRHLGQTHFFLPTWL